VSTALPLETEAEAATLAAVAPFDEVYETHFGFVWRSLARLGVLPASLDDATQDVFIVVHRRLSEYEARASIRSWLFAIALRVARDYRRTRARKDGKADPLEDFENELHCGDSQRSPESEVARAEARRIVGDFLESLPAEQRDVFVLMELEQLTAPETARELGIEPRLVYSRREAARRAFEKHIGKTTKGSRT
jgi:RNA polymerase sigma-70 factor (ECF subfamily)